jgi:arylsulfatase A-like enzyme
MGTSNSREVGRMRIESLNRRDFLGVAMSGAAAMTFGRCLPAEAAAPSGRRLPNIVLIVSDDQGYAEMGVQGCRDIPTPTLDSIAKNGVRFTNGYVSCPVCSPTRAGLMTGRYQQRFGHEFNPGPAEQADASFGLSLKEVTVANRLKSLGYATGMVGKWHLGYKPEYHPQKRGFDEFYGFLGGAHPYLPGPGRQGGAILRGTEEVDAPPYLTEAFAREAVAFIQRHQDKPFFLYLPFNAVHAPLQSTEKYLSRFAAISDPKRRTFAAMLSAMDDAIAQVLGRLRESKLEENTLIFFISDNGGPTEQTSSCNVPLRGYKGQVLEGGIRVPFMVQWKGHLPAGKVYEQPVISLDIHPTAVAAAGGKIGADAKLDGVNLLPYLTGENKAVPHDRLFWRFGQQWAIRMGDWKLEKGPERGGPELFDLAKDIGEKDNLAGAQPEKVKELQAAYDAWNAQLAEPRWRQGGGGGRGGRGGGGGGQRRARRGRAGPES